MPPISSSRAVSRRAMLRQSGLGLLGLSTLKSPGQAAEPRAAGGTAPAPAGGYERDPAWLKTKYGPWGGPGVNPTPGPMDDIRVRDYAPVPSLVLPENLVARARFPAIDIHAHNNAKTPQELAAWVRTMDEVGVETTVILTSATGDAFDRVASLYLAHPKRFQVYCGLLATNIDQPDYPRKAAAELERCYRKGARGIGELSDKGMGFGSARLPRDQRLHLDDARLDPFFKKCGELKIPVVAHIADHPSCWKPLDVYQERPPQYQHFNLHGKDVPTHAELIASRDRALAKHRQTTFIACHLGNQGHDLGTLSRALEQHPNLFLDISARDYEVGRTPRAAVKFLTKHRDRVLFGTDMGREVSMYRAWWRLFETADEFMPGRVWWPYYGLELAPDILEALYRGNARRLMRQS
ncbi:MAG: amidohydrolase family protein [Opitutaceae bacterium]|nr:amidohydrolase family protein [Opitutaceae bacterium]